MWCAKLGSIAYWIGIKKCLEAKRMSYTSLHHKHKKRLMKNGRIIKSPAFQAQALLYGRKATDELSWMNTNLFIMKI